uniref:Uncharacterized protein n=1 Tax=Arundo donax TaxID=35708 RepID=A0A0A9AAH7_ARUDO
MTVIILQHILFVSYHDSNYFTAYSNWLLDNELAYLRFMILYFCITCGHVFSTSAYVP